MSLLTLTLGLRPELTSPRRDAEFTMEVFDEGEVCAGFGPQGGFIEELDHVDRLPFYTVVFDGRTALRLESRVHEVAHLWVQEGPAALVEARVMALEDCILTRMGLPRLAAWEPSLDGADSLRDWDGDSRQDYEAAFLYSRFLRATVDIGVIAQARWPSWSEMLRLSSRIAQEDFSHQDVEAQHRHLSTQNPGARRWQPEVVEPDGAWHTLGPDTAWHCVRYTGEIWEDTTGAEYTALGQAGAAVRLRNEDRVIARPIDGRPWTGSCVESERGVISATAAWTDLAADLELPETGERVLAVLGGPDEGLQGHTLLLSDAVLPNIDADGVRALLEAAAGSDPGLRKALWRRYTSPQTNSDQ